jgi:hypothetical protein
MADAQAKALYEAKGNFKSRMPEDRKACVGFVKNFHNGMTKLSF